MQKIIKFLENILKPFIKTETKPEEEPAPSFTESCFDEKDERNFGASAAIEITKADLVNKSFVVFDPTDIDQTDCDFCVGCSGSYGSEATEKRVGAFAYLFAMAKKLVGEYASWGISILSMCKARVTYGICKKELWDYQTGRRNYFANWNNIPTAAHADAAQHKGASFWEVDTPLTWSRFDAIRAYLWKLKDQKILVHTGNNGHAITVIGYIANSTDSDLMAKFPKITQIAMHSGYTDVLVCKDSYGDRTYQEGYRFITRAEARTLFTPYVILDIERSLAELLVAYNNKAIKLEGNADCYLVKNGQKRLLNNEAIAWANGITFMPEADICTLAEDEFNRIPIGKPMEFYEGAYNKFVIRILEKLKPGEVEKIINAN